MSPVFCCLSSGSDCFCHSSAYWSSPNSWSRPLRARLLALEQTCRRRAPLSSLSIGLSRHLGGRPKPCPAPVVTCLVARDYLGPVRLASELALIRQPDKLIQQLGNGRAGRFRRPPPSGLGDWHRLVGQPHPFNEFLEAKASDQNLEGSVSTIQHSRHNPQAGWGPAYLLPCPLREIGAYSACSNFLPCSVVWGGGGGTGPLPFFRPVAARWPTKGVPIPCGSRNEA